jgi:hypothetical protein
MGHFARGRFLRYFIQPLLRDMLYLVRFLPFRFLACQNFKHLVI